jgi:hypothetical protein
VTASLLVLSAWAVAGSAVTLLAAALRRKHHAPAEASPRPV